VRDEPIYVMGVYNCGVVQANDLNVRVIEREMMIKVEWVSVRDLT